MREPILLGTDGRVWDGHPRLCVASMLGLDVVPVEVAIPTEPVDEVKCPKCGATLRAQMSDQPAVGVDFTVTVTDRAGRTVFIGAVDVARGDEYLVIDRAKDQPATLRCVASDLTAQLPAEQDGQR